MNMDTSRFFVMTNKGEFPPQPGDRWNYKNAGYLHIGNETIVYLLKASRDGSERSVIAVQGIQQTSEILSGNGVKTVRVSRIIQPKLKLQLEARLSYLGSLEFA
jgi:hypothetical protein